MRLYNAGVSDFGIAIDVDADELSLLLDAASTPDAEVVVRDGWDHFPMI